MNRSIRMNRFSPMSRTLRRWRYYGEDTSWILMSPTSYGLARLLNIKTPSDDVLGNRPIVKTRLVNAPSPGEALKRAWHQKQEQESFLNPRIAIGRTHTHLLTDTQPSRTRYTNRQWTQQVVVKLVGEIFHYDVIRDLQLVQRTANVTEPQALSQHRPEELTN